MAAAAAKDLVDSKATEKRERASGEYAGAKRKRENDSDEEEELLNISSRSHCYICKQWGHSKKDCPLAKCQYCNEIGHRSPAERRRHLLFSLWEG